MEYPDVLKFAKEFGLWAALFVGLLIWVLKTSGKREERLTILVEKLADKFDIMGDIKSGVDRIERKLEYRPTTNGGK